MRLVLVIVAILALVAALAGIKGAQIATLVHAGKQFEKAGPPPEAVSTAVAREEAWEGTLSAVGSIAAVKGVAVSNEAPGMVSAIRFESGEHVREGAVLVELDARVERAQLASAVARRSLAQVTLARARALLASNSIARAEVDTAQTSLDSADADARAIEAQIAHKIVRAPFTGRLGIRAVNIGQYLSPGTTVTVLEAVGSVFVDFTLPQQNLASVDVGMPIRVTLGHVPKTPSIDGTISAIDPTIDPLTRTIRVRATVPDQEERLRPGMFVDVAVILPREASAVVVPRTAIVHAAYGDSVFVAEDKKDANGENRKVVRQQFVRTGRARGDFVAVQEGIKAGDEVVVAGAFKLRNGAPIRIEPDVKPAPELAPHLENR